MAGAPKNRWIQLGLCVAVFAIISGPQYSWALFVPPLLGKLGATLSELQVTFSLVVVCMTFVTPAAGYLHDRFRARHLVALGLLLSSGSWVLASGAGSLAQLYVLYGVTGGLGAGIAFIGCTGLVQRIFPDKRGLATGILMSGYALGPSLTTGPISRSLAEVGIDKTLWNFGLAFALIGIAVAAGIREAAEMDTPSDGKSKCSAVAAKEMLRTPVFWLMFAMMTTIATCGMMVTSNIAVIARERGIGSGVYLFGIAALPLALILDRVTNGLSRILFGAVSDWLGRENTLALAFALEGLFMVFWSAGSSDPRPFVLLSGLVFLAWGELFSIFPALCTDTFGERNASVNFGFLYASVGIGSIIGGPIAAWCRESTRSWMPVFYASAFLDLVTAVVAGTLLKRARAAYRSRAKVTAPALVPGPEVEVSLA